MGTGLGFKDPARACYIALRLAGRGYGTLWDPHDAPRVIMSAAPRDVVSRIVDETRGKVITEWRKIGAIDT